MDLFLFLSFFQSEYSTYWRACVGREFRLDVGEGDLQLALPHALHVDSRRTDSPAQQGIQLNSLSLSLSLPYFLLPPRFQVSSILYPLLLFTSRNL